MIRNCSISLHYTFIIYVAILWLHNLIKDMFFSYTTCWGKINYLIYFLFEFQFTSFGQSLSYSFRYTCILNGIRYFWTLYIYKAWFEKIESLSNLNKTDSYWRPLSEFTAVQELYWISLCLFAILRITQAI